MDVPLVNTFMGADGAKNQDENWDEALRVWPDIVRFAQDHGRKLTFENCPMLFSYDEWPGGHNIATTPRMWRRILEQWPGTIGLNFDPSHLILQMIDIGRFLKEFGPHVLHYQAKDLLIDRDGLYERGIMSMGMGWQVPRIPGLGDVDWGVVHGELYRQGYEGDCIIEHEDRRFEGTDEKVKQGFLIARDVLRPSATDDDRCLSSRSRTDRARHREDDRSFAAAAGARRRVHRGRLPARGRVRRGLGLRPARGRRAAPRRSSRAPTWRWGRRSASRTAATRPRRRSTRLGAPSPTARGSWTW